MEESFQLVDQNFGNNIVGYIKERDRYESIEGGGIPILQDQS